MSFINMLLILVGVGLNTVAQLFLKQGMSSAGAVTLTLQGVMSMLYNVGTNLFILGGLFCYVLSFGVWLIVLSRVEVSTAYPMLSIGYIVTAIAGWYFWGESLVFNKVVGIGMICLGVVFLFKS